MKLVLNEAVTSKVAGVASTAGRCHGDVYVNGQRIYEDYGFKAYTDTVEHVSFGAVELNKGENTIEIHMTKNHFGTTETTSRRCCNLRSCRCYHQEAHQEKGCCR